MIEKSGPFTKFPDRLQWEGEGELYQIDAFGPDALRFRGSRSLRISEERWNLLEPGAATLEIEIGEEQAVVRNGAITAKIEAARGRITYLDASGRVLLREAMHQHHPGFARQYRSRGSDHFELKVTFDADKDERLHGMGQYPNDCLNLKGTVLELAQKNTQISIPFLLSSKGYGFIWNNPAVGRAELAMTHTSFQAGYARQIDYVVFPGETPADLVRHYSRLTGTAPRMPDHGTGFWQSKLRYTSQEELLGVAREYKRRGLPISVIVADFYHWPATGDWMFDPRYWPDPAAMVAELEEMGIKLLVSVWPTLAKASVNHDEFVRRNFTIRPEHGNNVFLRMKEDLTYIDPTHPGAREALWAKLEENYFDKGVRMFWLDEAEPEIEPLEYDNIRYHLGNGLEVSCLYPYYFAKAVHDGQRSRGQEDVLNLVRSGWIGSQRLGVLLWSGDIPGDFDSLRRQVKAGLNIGLCGMPWWTTDIGGFFGAEATDEYREVLLRWFQFGAFCPVMRLHGVRKPMREIEGQLMRSGADNEVWSFGDEALRIMTRYLHVREKLRPYIREHLDHASEDGIPLMRPMFLEFPGDEACHLLEDQYLFGPDLLVAPVLEAGAASRSVYLPDGAAWTDVFTGEVHEGGRTIVREVSLDEIPVFARDGFAFRIDPAG